MASSAVEVPEGNEVFGVTGSAFERFGYSAAVRSNGLLYIAGLIGLRPDGTCPEDIEGQTEWALRRTEEILRLEGLGFADLVEVVSYHVDIHENLAGFMEVKSRLVKERPAWSMIGASGLATPGRLIEIRSVAAYS
ncbi:Rid family hydrolase [Streptomyces coelicoflavus]|uniref:Rid family hydrolase n=1 Tax=Streptomyces coelicoflavus TaxID=285562 RepID=UPI0024AD6425|nr:Rid family hydrolase [Streptomyces coelicoflavus]MDI6520328.1 Rid family hydrolase [Streptomyces coelicoflavus]